MVAENLAVAAIAFVAAVVTGIAGFAFGLVAAPGWLRLLTPTETTILIAASALVIQGASTWRLRHALRPARLWPYLLGALAGIPLGVQLLGQAAPHAFRAGVGMLLVAYAIYALARPKLPPVTAGGRVLDAVVGGLSGVLGGATGLAGILPTIWCGLRGWPRDEQRAVFQPVAVAINALALIWLGLAGTIDRATIVDFGFVLPAILAGTWVGLKLYGRLDEARFRQIVLVLLLVAGASLLV
jgi:hypothetical protein